MRKHREAEIHRLIGGADCLDFANTLNGHQGFPAHEYLHDYRDLVLWARHAGILARRDAQKLLQQSETRPSQAQQAFKKALTLRETIFRIFAAQASRQKPAEADLQKLNQAWQEAQRHARLVPTSGGFAVTWDDEASLDQVARPLISSAVALLTSGNVKRVRMCAGDHCDWLFVDTSRNHLRRWCSMDECGNRAKMRRRQRRKQLAVPE